MNTLNIQNPLSNQMQTASIFQPKANNGVRVITPLPGHGFLKASADATKAGTTGDKFKVKLNSKVMSLASREHIALALHSARMKEPVGEVANSINIADWRVIINIQCSLQTLPEKFSVNSSSSVFTYQHLIQLASTSAVMADWAIRQKLPYKQILNLCACSNFSSGELGELSTEFWQAIAGQYSALSSQTKLNTENSENVENLKDIDAIFISYGLNDESKKVVKNLQQWCPLASLIIVSQQAQKKQEPIIVEWKNLYQISLPHVLISSHYFSTTSALGNSQDTPLWSSTCAEVFFPLVAIGASSSQDSIESVKVEFCTHNTYSLAANSQAHLIKIAGQIGLGSEQAMAYQNFLQAMRLSQSFNYFDQLPSSSTLLHLPANPFMGNSVELALVMADRMATGVEFLMPRGKRLFATGGVASDSGVVHLDAESQEDKDIMHRKCQLIDQMVQAGDRILLPYSWQNHCAEWATKKRLLNISTAFVRSVNLLVR